MNYYPVSPLSLSSILHPKSGIDMENLLASFLVSFSVHAMVIVPCMYKLGMF